MGSRIQPAATRCVYRFRKGKGTKENGAENPAADCFTHAKAVERYYQQGELDKALRDWSRAIELNSSQVEAYIGRTTAYLRKKDYAKAVQELEAIARLNAKQINDILNTLAWLRATCSLAEIRNGKAAIETATKACGLTYWKNGKYIDTLAAAYAETGDFDHAIEFQKQAL